MNVTIRPVMLDVARIREDFPILRRKVRGKDLVFLDSAASAQKPRVVIDAMREAMETQYANVHRGLHWMSERTTDAYEAARDAVAGLLNAPDRHEVVITRNVKHRRPAQRNSRLDVHAACLSHQPSTDCSSNPRTRSSVTASSDSARNARTRMDRASASGMPRLRR